MELDISTVTIDDQNRFLLDLEFVQALSNFDYLQFLVQHENKYMEDPDFIAYLAYLMYWKDPKYSKFILFPHCLHVLGLLQEENFRKQLSNPWALMEMKKQQKLHWQWYNRNRRFGHGTRPDTEEKTEVKQEG